MIMGSTDSRLVLAGGVGSQLSHRGGEAVEPQPQLVRQSESLVRPPRVGHFPRSLSLHDGFSRADTRLALSPLHDQGINSRADLGRVGGLRTCWNSETRTCTTNMKRLIDLILGNGLDRSLMTRLMGLLDTFSS
jgi:hypothetical protein